MLGPKTPFSADLEFVWVQPPALFDGRRDIQVGELVDKSRLDARRLQTMFELRRIAPAGFADSPKPAYLENGRGKADKLAKEIAAEEAAQNSEGEGAQASQAKPAPAAKPKPSAKPARKQRAA